MLQKPLRAIVVCNNDMMARQVEKIIDVPVRDSADRPVRAKELHDIQFVVSVRRSISTDQHNYWQDWAKKNGVPYIATNSGALLHETLKNEYGLRDEPQAKKAEQFIPPQAPLFESKKPEIVQNPSPAPAPADPISVALRAMAGEYERQLQKAKEDRDTAESMALDESEKNAKLNVLLQETEAKLKNSEDELKKIKADTAPLDALRETMRSEIAWRDKKIAELTKKQEKDKEIVQAMAKQFSEAERETAALKKEYEEGLTQMKTGEAVIDETAMILIEILTMYFGRRPIYGKDITKFTEEFKQKNPAVATAMNHSFVNDIKNAAKFKAVEQLVDSASKFPLTKAGKKDLNAIKDELKAIKAEM